jgi:hypothetical protein
MIEIRNLKMIRFPSRPLVQLQPLDGNAAFDPTTLVLLEIHFRGGYGVFSIKICLRIDGPGMIE